MHQLCTAHLHRDLADAAETYPQAHWPVQITQALQAMIHAANTAREQGLAAIPAGIMPPLEKAFRHGVLLGLKEVRENPGRKQEPLAAIRWWLRRRPAPWTGCRTRCPRERRARSAAGYAEFCMDEAAAPAWAPAAPQPVGDQITALARSYIREWNAGVVYPPETTEDALQVSTRPGGAAVEQLHRRSISSGVSSTCRLDHGPAVGVGVGRADRRRRLGQAETISMDVSFGEDG